MSSLHATIKKLKKTMKQWNNQNIFITGSAIIFDLVSMAMYQNYRMAFDQSHGCNFACGIIICNQAQ